MQSCFLLFCNLFCSKHTKKGNQTPRDAPTNDTLKLTVNHFKIYYLFSKLPSPHSGILRGEKGNMIVIGDSSKIQDSVILEEELRGRMFGKCEEGVDWCGTRIIGRRRG